MTRISKRTVVIGVIVAAIPVLVLAWWLGSPLFIDRQVDEGFPLSASAEIPADMTKEEVEAEMSEAAASTSETLEDMPASESDLVEVASGGFVGADDFHQGAGRATIYEMGDGQRVLRLEDFMVTNGPNLHVFLVPDPDPQTRSDIEGYLDLGALKGNVGNQNYQISADADISLYESVLIYCVPFHVIFATATLG